MTMKTTPPSVLYALAAPTAACVVVTAAGYAFGTHAPTYVECGLLAVACSLLTALVVGALAGRPGIVAFGAAAVAVPGLGAIAAGIAGRVAGYVAAGTAESIDAIGDVMHGLAGDDAAPFGTVTDTIANLTYDHLLDTLPVIASRQVGVVATLVTAAALLVSWFAPRAHERRRVAIGVTLGAGITSGYVACEWLTGAEPTAWGLLVGGGLAATVLATHANPAEKRASAARAWTVAALGGTAFGILRHGELGWKAGLLAALTVCAAGVATALAPRPEVPTVVESGAASSGP